MNFVGSFSINRYNFQVPHVKFETILYWLEKVEPLKCKVHEGYTVKFVLDPQIIGGRITCFSRLVLKQCSFLEKGLAH